MWYIAVLLPGMSLLARYDYSILSKIIDNFQTIMAPQNFIYFYAYVCVYILNRYSIYSMKFNCVLAIKKEKNILPWMKFEHEPVGHWGGTLSTRPPMLICLDEGNLFGVFSLMKKLLKIGNLFIINCILKLSYFGSISLFRQVTVVFRSHLRSYWLLYWCKNMECTSIIILVFTPIENYHVL